MTERFGRCRFCAGRGYLEIEAKCPVLHTIKKKEVPCGACDGSGASGDAIDYLKDQERLERIGQESWEWAHGPGERYGR